MAAWEMLRARGTLGSAVSRAATKPGRCRQIAKLRHRGDDGCGAGSGAWPQPRVDAPQAWVLSPSGMTCRKFPTYHPACRHPPDFLATTAASSSACLVRLRPRSSSSAAVAKPGRGRAWPVDVRPRSAAAVPQGGGHLSTVVTHRCLACTEPPDDAVYTRSSDQLCIRDDVVGIRASARAIVRKAAKDSSVDSVLARPLAPYPCPLSPVPCPLQC